MGVSKPFKRVMTSSSNQPAGHDAVHGDAPIIARRRLGKRPLQNAPLFVSAHGVSDNSKAEQRNASANHRQNELIRRFHKIAEQPK